MIKSVYDKMPSMAHKTVAILIPILLFGPIQNVYGIDLCIFLGNCNQNNEQPSQPRDGIDGAIQIDNDWIQQEDSNNNQV